jgi:hypothetical protein
MSYTQTDLDAIDAAIKTGTTRVSYGDRDVTYRSLDDMLRIRDLIRGELGVLPGGNSAANYPRFSKGLC